MCESTPGRHWIRVMIFTAEPAAILCLGRSSSLPAFGGGTRRQPQERQPICPPLNRPDPFESASLHTPRAAATARPAKATRLQLFPSLWTRPAFLCASTHPGGDQASPTAQLRAQVNIKTPESTAQTRIRPESAHNRLSPHSQRPRRAKYAAGAVLSVFSEVQVGKDLVPFTGGKPRPPQQAWERNQAQPPGQNAGGRVCQPGKDHSRQSVNAGCGRRVRAPGPKRGSSGCRLRCGRWWRSGWRTKARGRRGGNGKELRPAPCTRRRLAGMS